MNTFQLNPDQKALWDHVTDFTKNEIHPIALKCDKQQSFPSEVIHKAKQAGILNSTVNESYGGGGLSALDFAIITERLSWGCVAIGGALSLNAMIADVLKIAGSDEQKKIYLTRLCEGEFGGYCMTEPNTGSDVIGLQTSAQKKSDKYILNGSKTWISNADMASFFVVFAKTNKEAGHNSLSAFLVERQTPGVELGKKLEKMGQRACTANEVYFNDVEVPATQLLGKEGDGFLIAMQVFDHSRPMVAALGVGLTQRCLDEALAYSKTRESMGKKIIKHQSVAIKLANMAMELEAARLLTYKASSLLDEKQNNTMAASIAKTYAGDVAVRSSSEALQIFGGMGYSPEYPMEKLYRDAKVLQIYEGTNEIQRLIIARELGKQ